MLKDLTKDLCWVAVIIENIAVIDENIDCKRMNLFCLSSSHEFDRQWKQLFNGRCYEIHSGAWMGHLSWATRCLWVLSSACFYDGRRAHENIKKFQWFHVWFEVSFFCNCSEHFMTSLTSSCMRICSHFSDISLDVFFCLVFIFLVWSRCIGYLLLSRDKFHNTKTAFFHFLRFHVLALYLCIII